MRRPSRSGPCDRRAQIEVDRLHAHPCLRPRRGPLVAPRLRVSQRALQGLPGRPTSAQRKPPNDLGLCCERGRAAHPLVSTKPLLGGILVGELHPVDEPDGEGDTLVRLRRCRQRVSHVTRRGPRVDLRQLLAGEEPAPATSRTHPGPERPPRRRLLPARWPSGVGAARLPGDPRASTLRTSCPSKQPRRRRAARSW